MITNVVIGIVRVKSFVITIDTVGACGILFCPWERLMAHSPAWQAILIFSHIFVKTN